MRVNFQDVKYIPGLDGFRAIAVLLVLVAHFGYDRIVPGGLGVTIFFFISGFLITSLLLSERNKFGSISIRNFYIRRFLRLLPELTGLVVVSGFYRALLGHPLGIGEIVAAFTYTTNYFVFWLENHGGAFSLAWPQLWSLSVEEHYYITFPAIFAFLLTSSARARVFFASVFILGLAYRLFLVLGGHVDVLAQHPYTYLASEARFDSIAYGAALAFLCQRAWELSRGKGMAVGLAGGLLLLLTLLVRGDVFRETIRYSIQGVALLLVFTAIYRSAAWDWTMSILESSLFRRLGVLSYGAYLWHFEYLFLSGYVFGDVPPTSGAERLIFLACGLVFSFGAAELSYRFIAQPMQTLRHHFSMRAPSPTAAE
ncbi:acyltransferase family protein [Pleomorphomonas sp. PLEO]|uniref:acyltransferase family protein n=1 Tax=Pleomorphomonas sp. PLEO TaxID=3239306 RepID=UPI00351ECF9B